MFIQRQKKRIREWMRYSVGNESVSLTTESVAQSDSYPSILDISSLVLQEENIISTIKKTNDGSLFEYNINSMNDRSPERESSGNPESEVASLINITPRTMCDEWALNTDFNEMDAIVPLETWAELSFWHPIQMQFVSL